MEGLGLVVGGVALVALFVAWLTAPRWGSGNIWHHRLWKLRDDVADDVIHQRLPGDHPAVKELMNCLDWQLRRTRPRSLIAMLLFHHLVIRRMSDEEIRRMDQEPEIGDLTTAQQQLIREHRQQWATTSGAAVITSSWLGLLMVTAALLGKAPRNLRSAAERVSRRRVGRSAARSLRRYGHVAHA